MLRPADPLDILLRILNNIRAWAAARPEQVVSGRDAHGDERDSRTHEFKSWGLI